MIKIKTALVSVCIATLISGIFAHKLWTQSIEDMVDLQVRLAGLEFEVRSRPNFEQEAASIRSSLNKSKLKHVLMYAHTLSEEYGVPYGIVKRVIVTESSWNHRAVSHKQATGLMQVSSIVAHMYGTPTADLMDPYVNVTLGIKYLADLHTEFQNWPSTLTAYNHGPTRARKYTPQYQQNNQYLSKVFGRSG
jgi:soluble lytic murein transglycosylase-like protein